MAGSRIKVWNLGERLTAADLNAEFNNTLNLGIALISPATADLAMGGFRLTGVSAGSVSNPAVQPTGDANTGMYFSGADAVDFATGSVRAFSIGTASSGVNYLQVAPSATGGNVALTALGSDTNPGIDIISKGTGQINFKRAAGATTDGQMASGVFIWGAPTSTGTSTGDIVVKNTGAYRFTNAAGTSSANYGVHGSADNNMEFETPSTGDGKYNFYRAGSLRMAFKVENDGMGILFNNISSGDHSAPAASAAIIYSRDNGGGKVQLVARFPSGAVQQIALEP
jgi:hypothetical protein